MQIKQIVLKSRPNGVPTEANFAIEEISLSNLQAGEVHLKGLYYSVDPYMRGRMNDAKSYTPPFQINQPISGGAVAEVIESKDENFKKGDIVTGMLPWANETIINTKGLQKIDVTIAPASYYLGILGMPGLTAYFGLIDIAKPQSGETVVVSGAAGAVGIIVGQIAKIYGCHVVGIAGSDEKIALLKDKFGFDQGINYKTEKNLAQAIADSCPKGVDIYFDNVGGEISDAVVKNINFHARITLCGQISLYNLKEIPVGPRLQPMLLTRSVLMQGFIIGNYQKRFSEGIKELSQWVKEGKLTYTETIIEGFENLPKALIGLFSGDNSGKMIVKL
ncbi:MAG: NADP-dependent oxidoreductase [Candidatus Sericytochromatia bacterium]|nr:NADP-dependent oxidoreductase [Candidatus Sericytochromatia bacterium]